MYLHRLHLDTTSKEARRDLADPYQMHATLCRAFSTPFQRCAPGEFLWRLEPEGMHERHPRLLVQSRRMPDWSHLATHGWLARADAPIPLSERLKLDSLSCGDLYRFRLRGNPCAVKAGKRQGCLHPEEQQAWMIRKGPQHGFAISRVPDSVGTAQGSLLALRMSPATMLRGRQHSGNIVCVLAVLYEGLLQVTDPSLFAAALQTGIGHGKCLGLGMLSIVPIRTG
jgi:CRISPR system Cascade subunit CasE